MENSRHARCNTTFLGSAIDPGAIHLDEDIMDESCDDFNHAYQEHGINNYGHNTR